MTQHLVLRTILLSETYDGVITAAMAKAASTLAKGLRKKPQDLINVALAAFNPSLPEDAEELPAVETILYATEVSISSKHKDRPVALLRAVMVLALYELLDDLRLGAILYLALSDTLTAISEQNEAQLRDDFLMKARDVYLAAAQEMWDKPVEDAPTAKAGKPSKSKAAVTQSELKVQFSAMKPDALSKSIESAVSNGEALTNTGYVVNPPWLALFAPQLASALTTTINEAATAVAQSVNSGIGKAITSMEQKVAEAQATEQRLMVQARQADILWWLQVKYSVRRDLAYREMGVPDGVAQMALDFQSLIPAPVPPHVEAVIYEAVRSTYASADEPANLLEILTMIQRGESSPDAPRTLWAWVGQNAEAEAFAHATGVPADTSVTPVALARWLFRQAQAQRIS